MVMEKLDRHYPLQKLHSSPITTYLTTSKLNMRKTNKHERFLTVIDSSEELKDFIWLRRFLLLTLAGHPVDFHCMSDSTYMRTNYSYSPSKFLFLPLNTRVQTLTLPPLTHDPYHYPNATLTQRSGRNKRFSGKIMFSSHTCSTYTQ